MVPIVLSNQKNVLVLSPLAGITIPPFRRLCAEFGAITVSEMTFARGIVFREIKSLKRIQRAKNEKIFGIQILTNSTKDFEEVINYIESKKDLCDFIELNLGCPKPKIVAANLGSALLKSNNIGVLKKLLEIGNSSTIPFSIKIRAGYDRPNFIHVLKLAEQYSCAFVTFHARLAIENFAQPARHAYWLEAAQESTVPIIANGDVRTQFQANDIITNCEKQGIIGVAIGRAARGNPQIFQRNSFKIHPIMIYDRFVKYLRESSYFNSINIKIQSSDFLKHYRYAARIRKKLVSINDPSVIVELTREHILKNSYYSNSL